MHRWPAPIDHAYILCDPAREPDRAAYLTAWLGQNQIDPACYTMGLSCYGDTLSVDEAFKVYNPWQNRKPVERGRSHGSYNLKLGEISLVLNWAAAAKAAVAAGYEVVLFLESDVLFFPEFLTALAQGFKALEGKPWDFLSLSAGADLRPARPPETEGMRGWFPCGGGGYYHTRTTDAMIFRGSMLEKIIGTLFPFCDVLDWELNYQLSLHNSTSLWLDPPILRQGSSREYATTL